MPGHRIDFSSSARDSGRGGLFTSTGIIGMVEAKDMKSALTMLPFMGALLDRTCREAEYALLTRFSRCTRTLRRVLKAITLKWIAGSLLEMHLMRQD
jgi:hypothetical protein